MQCDLAARSTPGNRYHRNHDAFLMNGIVHQGSVALSAAHAGSGALVAVADGVAAGYCASLASRTVLSSLDRLYRMDRVLDRHLVRRIQSELADAAGRRCHGMATTLAALSVDDQCANVVGVGDSRVYLFRDGLLRQMTQDHTLRAALEDEAHDVGEDLTGSAWDGLDSCLIADQQEDQFAICHARYPVQGGDIWLLCSDGLTASLDDAALGGVLGSMVDLAAACDRLVHAAVADAMNDDNITVALLRVRALGDGVQELS